MGLLAEPWPDMPLVVSGRPAPARDASEAPRAADLNTVTPFNYVGQIHREQLFAVHRCRQYSRPAVGGQPTAEPRSSGATVEGEERTCC
jgi:hypothetical protein